MKTQEFIVQRLETLQDKWYDVLKLTKLNDVKTNLLSIKETQPLLKFRVIQRTITERKVKV